MIETWDDMMYRFWLLMHYGNVPEITKLRIKMEKYLKG